ncbi:hypothetical protein M0805_009622 [Coniferiporia weirii]|nr:hypothetical protein M0805_009622 [Coniferiporia weirii]
MTSILTSTAHAAHAAASSLFSAAPIAVGDALPAHPSLKDAGTPDPAAAFEAATRLAKGRVVLVGVPGAFTPACGSQVPGFLERADAFAAKGGPLSRVCVVAVNDAFVVQAWKEKLTGGEPTPVQFLADDQGAFTAALGMLFDASALLGGPRSKRYVVVAEDGLVTHVAVEQDPTEVTVTRAEVILAQL